MYGAAGTCTAEAMQKWIKDQVAAAGDSAPASTADKAHDEL